jgi:hypothetical protein
MEMDKSKISNMNNWSDEEDCHHAFASSSVTVRTPVKAYTTLANVENAPKKKETTMMMKLKGESVTSATNEQEAEEAIEDPNMISTWEGIIKTLESVQNTLSQDKIRGHQKASAYEEVGWVIDKIRATSALCKQSIHMPTSLPPSTPPAASQLITGTPIDQANTFSISSSAKATTTHKTPIQKAQDTLDVALKYLNKSYKTVGERIKKGADPKSMVVEMPLSTFEVIGKNVSDATHHLSHHGKHSEDIGERLSRLEATIKESLENTTKT